MIPALIASLATSFVSLVGAGLIIIQQNRWERFISLLIPLAAGTLLGDVALHILPELHETPEVLPAIVIGVLILYILELWSHQHTDTHGHAKSEVKRHIIINNLVGDGIHNLIDGIAIGISFQVSVDIGIATTLAVILHEIPQELSDFGILLYGGLSRTKALLANLASALTSVLGVVISFIVGEVVVSITPMLLAVVAGMFLYLALGNLLPLTMHQHKFKEKFLNTIIVLIGIGLMFGLTLME